VYSECFRQKINLEAFDDVRKFVKTAKLPQITSVASIKEASSDPLAKANITCFVSIAQSLEGFSTTCPSPAPLAPYGTCVYCNV
jgi:hypothetical protein